MLLRLSILLSFVFSLSCLSAQQEEKVEGVGFSKGDLIHSSGRYLAYEDGSPFLYLGDTAWELINRLNEEEVEFYLENRKNKGFTVIQTVILDELEGIYTETPCGAPQLINGDIRQPHPVFFDWVDKVINMAADKGLYIALLPTWGDKVDKQWGQGPEIFDESSAYEYGRFLGERYGDFPNIIWVIGGDRSGEGKNYVIWEAMVKGIREKDKHHLMTYHPHGEHSSSFWFHEAEWLDFNMFQSGHAQTDYSIYRRLLLPDLRKQPTKPVMDSEPRYENIPVNFDEVNGRFDDYDVRTTLYQSMLSGACGYTYGCNEIWQMFAEDRTPYIAANTNWKDALDFPGAGQMIHFSKLWERFDFTQGKPSQHIIVTEGLKDDDYPVAFGNEKYMLVYFPKGNALELQLSDWTKEQINLQWMNPRTGELTLSDTKEINNSFILTPPSNGRGNDWILIIE